MLTGAEHADRAAATEVCSPELVLVDRSLAARARELLPEPDETLTRFEREIAFRRLGAASIDLVEDDRAHSSQSTSADSARRFAGRSRAARLWAAATVALALTAAVLLGASVNLRGTPAGADSFRPAGAATASSTAHEKPARSSSATKTKASSRGSSDRRESASEAAARRFAWAPVPDASGYRVEFFRGDLRIYSADTSRPQLALPSRWDLAGRSYRLSPGKYRWYVWPVISGLRRSQATVQAELVVR